MKDDIETLPDRQPDNRSDRFETANLINSALSTSRETAGPFWCSAAEAAYLHIPQRQPEPAVCVGPRVSNKAFALDR